MKKYSTTLPVRIQHIEDEGYHLLLKARVNGKPASLLIDTGASKTVFDKNRLSAFTGKKQFTILEKLSTGLGTTEMETHSSQIEKLQLGKLAVKDFEAIVIDLSHVNITYRKLELDAIDGVLGSDLLVKYNGVLDYRKKTLTLSWKK